MSSWRIKRKRKKEVDEKEQQVSKDGIKEEGRESEDQESTLVLDRFGKAIARHQ